MVFNNNEINWLEIHIMDSFLRLPSNPDFRLMMRKSNPRMVDVVLPIHSATPRKNLGKSGKLSSRSAPQTTGEPPRGK